MSDDQPHQPPPAAAKPLRSALKKSAAGGTTSANGTAAAKTAGDDATPRPTAALSAKEVAAANAGAAKAASAARIRAAAEEKATQLQETRAAHTQWAAWVTQVQMKLLGGVSAGEASAEPLVSPAPHGSSTGPVPLSVLSRARHVLTPAEFDEVCEERVADRRCAYPPCGSLLHPTAEEVSGKKYRLSLKAQRVYDVAQGQKFCGQECFVQTEIYRKGLSEEPFYLRQQMQPKKAAGASPEAAAAQSTQNAEAGVAAPASVSPAPNGAARPSSAAELAEPSFSPDPRAITQLRIVEKERTDVTPPQLPPAASASSAQNAQAAARAAAFAVEGYQSRTATAAAAAALSTSAAAAPAPAPALAASNVTPVAASAVVNAVGAVPSNLAKPSVHFASGPGGPAASAAALDSSPSSPAAPAAPTAASRPAVDARDFVPIAQLAPLLASRPSDAPPLSRAEFEALSDEERIDYLAHIALREQALISSRPAGGSSIPTIVSAATSSPARNSFTSVSASASTASPSAHVSALEPPPSDEKKIRRRKSAGEKAAAAAAQAAEHKDDGGEEEKKQEEHKSDAPVPAAAAKQSPARSAASSSSSSSAAPVSLLADDPDAPPLISPEEMQANIRSLRSAVMPPFVALLQVVMRWATSHTQSWMESGRLTSPPPHAQSRARHSALLGLVQTHWAAVTSALGVRGALDASGSRDLPELALTFAYDAPLPSLSSAQWVALTVLLLRAVALRRARSERLLPAGTHAHAWICVQLYSTLATDVSAAPTVAAPSPGVSTTSAVTASSACHACVSQTSPRLLAAVTQLLAQAGFTLEQVDSLASTLEKGGWMQ